MLNRDMQEELGERIANVIRKYDNHIIDLPYEQALSFVARLAVVEFAMYADFSEPEAKTITEVISEAGGPEWLIERSLVDYAPSPRLLTREELDAIPTPSTPIDVAKYNDDGTVIWHSTLQEAFQANE